MTDPRDAAVRRVLDRYIIEVVEGWGLCPWAAPARKAGELVIDLRWPPDDSDDAMVAVIEGWLAAKVPIGLMVLPAATTSPREHRAVRERLSARVPSVIIADFHPEAGDTPPRNPAHLVHLLRRSPDRMLQVVPADHLAGLAPATTMMRADQAKVLGGHLDLPVDPRTRIAEDNWRTVGERGADVLLALLAELAAERARIG
ncbi:MAG: hypothetical protein KBG28_26010 [Kofleriaceae bacterium]|nr:hypothetical protein [Kofleriaceae bacterium]MBP6841519.1 hypothetical protein [Kofleriaceae bacterium]MBP9207449.1 hypothetical protein [Kofleriaceae bacterium]